MALGEVAQAARAHPVQATLAELLLNQDNLIREQLITQDFRVLLAELTLLQTEPLVQEHIQEVVVAEQPKLAATLHELVQVTPVQIE